MASNTFVLVHGAFHGGWCWRRVADLLRRDGHRAFTPTCTGLGERAHQLSRDITIDTFATDVAGVMEAEELSDVVLVGHSFGGSPISLVADRRPERIRHLVYLDALVIPSGTSPFDGMTPEAVAARRKAADSGGGIGIPPPSAGAFGVPDGPDADWVERRLTPHPISSYESRLELAGPVGNGLPRTYICCTAPLYPALAQSRDWVRAQPGWTWLDIATGHDAMVTAPEELARMLLGIAAA